MKLIEYECYVHYTFRLETLFRKRRNHVTTGSLEASQHPRWPLRRFSHSVTGYAKDVTTSADQAGADRSENSHADLRQTGSPFRCGPVMSFPSYLMSWWDGTVPIRHPVTSFGDRLVGLWRLVLPSKLLFCSGYVFFGPPGEQVGAAQCLLGRWLCLFEDQLDCPRPLTQSIRPQLRPGYVFFEPTKPLAVARQSVFNLHRLRGYVFWGPINLLWSYVRDCRSAGFRPA